MIEAEEVERLHTEGKTVTEIAVALVCSYASVYQLHRKLSLVPNRKSSELHNRIVALSKERPDLTYDEIGKKAGCTRQNVSFVCLGKDVRRREQTEKEKLRQTAKQRLKQKPIPKIKQKPKTISI